MKREKTSRTTRRQRGSANLELLLVFLFIGMAIIGTLVGQIIPHYMQRNVAVRLQAGVDSHMTGLFPLSRLNLQGDIRPADSNVIGYHLSHLSRDLDNLTEYEGFCSFLWQGELVEDPQDPQGTVPLYQIVASSDSNMSPCCANGCPSPAIAALLEAELTIIGEVKNEVVVFHPKHLEFGLFGTSAYVDPFV